jgi:hypothetical protein
VNSSDKERQYVVDYLADQAPDETVEHLEKVKSERVPGRWIDVWDVYTDKERWWVITAPTNLYSQQQFPSFEVALSFHVGLTARVMEREERTAPQEQAARFTQAWRKWEQAGEALAEADEVEEFQSIGMRCRESLLAFTREAASIVSLDASAPPPKASDFNGWSDLIVNTIAAGSSAERRRGYLKSAAKSTWELANWLTHASSATRFDAYFAHMATGHVLSSWSLAILRFELEVPEHCPRCNSYRLETHFVTSDDGAIEHLTTCEVCAWVSEPRIAVIEDEVPSRSEQWQSKEDLGPCVFVEVPLRGPAPPKPTRHRKN